MGRPAASEVDGMSGNLPDAGLRTALHALNLAPSEAIASASDAARFCDDMIAIEASLAEIRYHLASKLAVSGPQWIVLSVLEDRDAGAGVSVREVARSMSVDPSFVTTQSKLLERQGLVRRDRAAEDGRVILMSLTALARSRLEAIALERARMKSFMFRELDGGALDEFLDRLSKVRDNVRKLSRLISV